MNMNQEKENWIDATMNSFDSFKRVDIPVHLKERLGIIPKEINQINNVPKIQVWAIAASIAFLIAINILSIKSSQEKKADNSNDIYTEYFSYLEDPS